MENLLAVVRNYCATMGGEGYKNKIVTATPGASSEAASINTRAQHFCVIIFAIKVTSNKSIQNDFFHTSCQASISYLAWHSISRHLILINGYKSFDIDNLLFLKFCWILFYKKHDIFIFAGSAPNMHRAQP